MVSQLEVSCYKEIEKVKKGINFLSIKSLPKKQRDEILSKVKSIEGITNRQAARILGVSPNLIFKCKELGGRRTVPLLPNKEMDTALS